MKNRKKPRVFPRTLIKSLGEDIQSLMNSSEGRLLSLEILEEIPYDARTHVLEGLSSFYYDEIAVFFQLVREEYGKELEAVCTRALEKLQMAGVRTNPPAPREREFFKAYVTRTRHTGQLTLDVAWRDKPGTLEVECFFLSFNSDGIHGFFVISEMSVVEYRKDRENVPDMIEISLEEASLLINQAYQCNVVHLTRPALGRILYRKYLREEGCQVQLPDVTAVMARISPELGPKELVNTFFFAWRYKDTAYIDAVTRDLQENQRLSPERLSEVLAPGMLLVEGHALDARTGRDRCLVKAYSVHVDEEELYRTELTFELARESGRWFIKDILTDTVVMISDGREGNPLQDQVECAVYDILDIDSLFNVLETVHDIREVGELPFGVHLRVIKSDEKVPDEGVYFLSGVMADIVINGDELVVIAREPEDLAEIDGMLAAESMPVQSVSRHRVEIITAYSYLSGQYLNFNDMLADEEEELFFQDGLRFLTARYACFDRDGVKTRLCERVGSAYQLSSDCEVFYEYTVGDRKLLLAEYLLGPNWVTVSAFGERELGAVRERFETGIKESLAFEGMEVRCEGIFELITADVRKQYPQLETELKRAYLDKWFASNLKPLSGMAPRDAIRSVEGKRLLWQMFKEMKRKEKIRKELGVRSAIELKEYVRHVDELEKKKS
ncbi:MAG: hypothetical protein ACM3QZ_09610 [Solirubrobacterales bacterium]